MGWWDEVQDQYFNYIGKLEENYHMSAEAITRHADNAGKLVNDAAMANIDTLKQYYNESDAFLAPWRQVGLDAASRFSEVSNQLANFDTSALKNFNVSSLTGFNTSALKNFEIKELSDLTGLNGDEALAEATSRVLQGADVQQAIQVGLDAVQRSAMSGSHGIRSGRLAQELQQFGQETSFGEVNKRREILMAMESDKRQGLAQALQMDLSARQSAAQLKYQGLADSLGLQMSGLQSSLQGYGTIAGLGANAASQSANMGYMLGGDIANQNMMGAQGLANAEMAKGNAWSNYYNARAEIDAMRTLATTGNQSPMFVLGYMQGGVR